jgi:lysophospholipase L1-like esterase
VEAPILRDGLRSTVRCWRQMLAEAARRQAGEAGRAVPVAVAAAVAIVVLVAGYGVIRPPAPAAPTGLLRQVANGERVSSASQSARPGASRPAVPGPGSSPAGCRRGPPRVSGDQVTAVGDSVMVASAAALKAALPGVYIDAQVDRQMQDGLAVLQDLAAAGLLRPVIVVGLGTNGTVTSGQLRQLRRIIGPARELVLVNTFGAQPWEHEVNAVLAAAARHARHAELADWDRAIAARPGLLWPDGVHPQPDGGRLYARVVLAAIRAGRPSACP